MRVYLAGPDVFLPDPRARAATLKDLCRSHGLVGVSPLDPLAHEPADWARLPEAFRIARRNEAHIASCDALVANLTPFRGPSADVGTVFELGFARALGRRLYGWTSDAAPFATRVAPDGMQVEDFGLHDNLMIEAAIQASGGAFVVADVTARTDLDTFEACLRTITP